jgi:hypothetical protein
MEHSSATDTDPSSPVESTARTSRVLCAYSPRWLSGPTQYRGLCATWSGDAPTRELPIVITN